MDKFNLELQIFKEIDYLINQFVQDVYPFMGEGNQLIDRMMCVDGIVPGNDFREFLKNQILKLIKLSKKKLVVKEDGTEKII